MSRYNGYGVGYGGGGGAAPRTWTTLTYAGITGTTDTNALLNGTPSDSGSDIVIPLSTSSNVVSMTAALRFVWALPAGICDGSNGALLVRLTFAAVPPGAYGACLGTYDASLVSGISAGARYKTGTAKMRPICARGASLADTTVDLTGTSLIVTGTVTLNGSYDGVDLLMTSATSSMGEAGASRDACIHPTATAALDATDQELCLAITHSGTGADAGDMTLQVEYSVLTNPFA